MPLTSWWDGPQWPRRCARAAAQWSDADPRPRLAQDFLTGGTVNFGKYSDETVSKMIADALAELDVAKGRQRIMEVQRKVLDDGGAGKWMLGGGVSHYAQWSYVVFDRPFILYNGKTTPRQ